MSKPTIDRLLTFQKLLIQFSQVERVTHRKDGESHVQENDTEHSYNLALTAWFLAPYFPHLNSDLLIRYALIHDLVEVHAGDTYVYADAATLATKATREADALKQLEREWPDFPDMVQGIESYEQKTDNEAKFIYALDKIMPIMMIYLADGYTWKQEGLTVEQLHAIKKSKVGLSPEIEPYYDELYQLLLTRPDLIPPK